MRLDQKNIEFLNDKRADPLDSTKSKPKNITAVRKI